MMSKWRCPQWIVLALVALLACASPSLLWACSSDQCVDTSSADTTRGKLATLSPTPCPDADCLDLHAPCCQPLPAPPNNSNVPAPPVKPTNSLGAVTTLLGEDFAASVLAVVPLITPVLEPVDSSVPIVPAAAFTLPRNLESPPLPGRSPPIF